MAEDQFVEIKLPPGTGALRGRVKTIDEVRDHADRRRAQKRERLFAAGITDNRNHVARRSRSTFQCCVQRGAHLGPERQGCGTKV